MTMTDPALEPCPFCGGMPRRAFIRATDDLSVWTVECSSCEAERASDTSQVEADALWNTRTPPAQAAVGELREALQAAQTQLEKAANQFAFYADEHAKKGTKEGDAKGATNHQWALACAKADHLCRDALATPAPAPSSVPEGWVLVPREPTEEMLSTALWELIDTPGITEIVDAWKAMLAAAPPQPAHPREDVSHG